MIKRMISIVIVVMMLTSSFPTLSVEVSADGTTPHWGEKSIQRWISKGMLGGYPDRSLKPDRPITRAEFTKLVNAVFRLDAKDTNSFTDVPVDAWFNDDIRAIKEAGIISGYSDGTFNPNAPITRQEAAKITVGLFKLPAAVGNQLAGFEDHDQVQTYAEEPLERLLAGGYIKGYPNKTVRPTQPITRAEAIALLDRLVAEVINTAGSYDNLRIVGNTIVNRADVNINNTVIDRDLFLTQGIGEGEVNVTDTEVKGTVYINGGGVNSIHLINTNLNKLVVNKAKGKVRVVLSGKSKVQQIIVESGSDLEIDDETNVALLTINEGVKGTKIKVKGTVQQINNDGLDTILNDKSLGKGSKSSVQKGNGMNGKSSSSGQSGGGSSTPTPDPELPKEEWKLVWNDEFDGSGDNVDVNGVNLDKWDYQLGTGSQYGLDGWGNNEEQYYRSENISVVDGKLTIRADDDGFGGKAYTSGRLYTKPTFSKVYGKFEARMKLPVGDGVWPGFWMMPQDSEYGAWAASGEIDIMEARGRLPKEVGGTIHYGRNWPNNKFTGAEYEFGNDTSITDFHTYGLEWEPGELRWYVDGKLYQKLNNWDSWGADQPSKYAFPAPFDKPFHMILNLAVGGNYDGGRVPDPSLLPGKMEVDYVRVYDLTGRPYKTPVEPTIDSEPYPDQYKKPMEGNFVHDMSYNQPFTTIAESDQTLDTKFWNFVHVSTFQGNGSISVDPIKDVRFAKADISAAGNAAHAVQLIQNVTLGKGRWYKLTFDGKSNTNRNMIVKFSGGEHRGWTTYSDSLEARLSNSLQSYEMIFQMGAETDTLARMEFNLGLSTHPVWIGNVKVEEMNSPDPYHDNAPKEPLKGNNVYNGTFDIGRIDRMTYWNFDATGGKDSATVDAASRELKVSIGDGVAEPGAVTLTQKGMNLIKGNDYKVTFKARATTARSIQLGLTNGNGKVYASPESMALTAEMKEHTLLFTMADPTDVNGLLKFLLGGQQGDIYLDDITMVRLTNHSIGELALADQFPVKNGDFSNDKVKWSEHVQGNYDGWGSSATFTIQDEEMKIAIANEGMKPWDVMLMQTDFNLFKSNTYRVTMYVRSSKNRDMEIVIDDKNTRYLSEKVQLTETKQMLSYELQAQSDITPSFKLLLGKLEGASEIGAHDVYVDNIRVELKDARMKAFPLKNGYFDAGLQDWSTHVQGIYDGTSRAVFTADNGAVKAAIANTGANAWDIMLQQGSLALLKGKTYIVSFAARASTPRTMEAIVENSSYFRYLNEKVQLDNVTQTYSYEFTMDKDEVAGFKLLMGNQTGAPTAPHDVFIDNVLLELKGAKGAAGEKARSTNDITLTQPIVGPPTLMPDTSANFVGEAIEIRFVDNEAWRTALEIIEVNGTPLAVGEYILQPGSIIIDQAVFASDQLYMINIKATGLGDTSVKQLILAADANLVLNGDMSNVSIREVVAPPVVIDPTPDRSPVNMALNKKAIVSSLNTVFETGLLTDDNKDTRWEADWEANQTAPCLPEWLYIDLNSVYSIGKIVLIWESAYGNKLDIQVAAEGSDLSDTSPDWQTVHSLNRELTGVGKLEEAIVLTSITQARYVRITVTDKGIPPYGPSLYEIEVYE